MKKYRKIGLLSGLAAVMTVLAVVQWFHNDVASEGSAQDTTLSALNFAQEPRPVRLHEVRYARAGETRVYPGVVSAGSEVDLSFRVGGPLVQVKADPGSVVKRGQPLMQIDPRDFQDNIAVLEAELAGAKASLEDARLDFERMKPLRRKDVVSQSQYDKAQTLYASASARLKNVEAQLRIARHRLEDTTLRAPFDGIVSVRLLENHEMVSAGQNALRMHNISHVEVHVNIPENELARYNLGKGGIVEASFPAISGRTFQATLHEWSAEADPVTRAYEVTFTLTPPADFKGVSILPGMTAEIRWGVASDKGGRLTIPASAVTGSDDGNSMVWVYDPVSGQAESRLIDTGGLVDGSRLQVLGGLEDGEIIVAAGVDFITPGMKLRPLGSRTR